ncbi:B-cell scaffold protein with ankyrin repeats-like isoform X2 [Rhincodon typus]|uniref:B-cell scaffold protein with ankyrin repeats-like isoform X2 n=1 Tax=Rhincodon typus TaxID=259920 RepID=UPI00202DE495|nr:B-cell scaffold protein with ankyrin repeats-like isoform X2 [Rhincodon typus]
MVEDEKAMSEEDPYSLTMDDEDPYDLILPEDKKESTAFIVKRPPAPIPRPTTLQCVDNTPFIAQVFQQKTGKGTNDKLGNAPKRVDFQTVCHLHIHSQWRIQSRHLINQCVQLMGKADSWWQSSGKSPTYFLRHFLLHQSASI